MHKEEERIEANRKRLQKEWNISEDYYKDLVEKAGIAILIDKTDGTFEYFNSTFAEMFGYGIDEMNNQKIQTLVHPEDIEGVIGYHNARLHGKNVPARYEFRGVKKDGSTIFLEVDAVVLKRGKKIHGTRSYLRDITDRKRMEEALKKAHDRLEERVKERTAELVATNEQLMVEIAERRSAQEEQKRLISIIENSQDFIGISTLDGKVLFVNEAGLRLLGLKSLEEVKSKQILDFLSEEAVVDLEKKHVSQIFEKGYCHGESTMRPFGTTKEIEIAFNLFFIKFSESGEPTELAIIVRDISERKSLEEQLRQSQKMEAVGRLAGGVAHDFNNLLTVIIGYSELIDSSLDPSDPLSGDVKEVRKAANSAALLTSQLLAFSRKQTIDPMVININQTVEYLEKMLKRLIEEDVALILVLSKDLWQSKVDPGQLQQILVNLTVNARDAMHGKGNLTIETANVVLDEAYCKEHLPIKPGEYVMLAVSDEGCGMEKEVLENSFEPFFTTKGNGTGLGLSTVYGIVKQHGGFIYVNSEPGHGSTFRIYLPRVHEEVAVIAEPVVKAAVACRETVLLVEDEDRVLKLSKRILEKEGYHVLEANNGGVAYLRCKKYEKDIHLLLTDVVMPEINGKELYEQVALMKPGIKVLYMSGYTNDIIAYRGVLEKGTRFIQKPFKPDALLRKVREALDE